MEIVVGVACLLCGYGGNPPTPFTKGGLLSRLNPFFPIAACAHRYYHAYNLIQSQETRHAPQQRTRHRT